MLFHCTAVTVGDGPLELSPAAEAATYGSASGQQAGAQRTDDQHSLPAPAPAAAAPAEAADAATHATSSPAPVATPAAPAVAASAMDPGLLLFLAQSAAAASKAAAIDPNNPASVEAWLTSTLRDYHTADAPITGHAGLP